MCLIRKQNKTKEIIVRINPHRYFDRIHCNVMVEHPMVKGEEEEEEEGVKGLWKKEKLKCLD